MVSPLGKELETVRRTLCLLILKYHFCHWLSAEFFDEGVCEVTANMVFAVLTSDVLC